MSEDLPFGSRGGLAVRHHFPLDAEYVIKVDLSRNLDGGQIRGVHEMEVRLDRALVQRITVDASKGGRAAARRRSKSACPSRPATRLVSVSFVGSIDQQLPRDGRPSPPPPTAFAYQLYPIDAAVNNIQIVGPYDGKVPENAATRDARSSCASRRRRATKMPVRAGFCRRLARRAYRRPVTDADLKPLLQAYDGRTAKEVISSTGSSGRSKRCWCRRSSSSASRRSRADSPGNWHASPTWSWRRGSRSSYGAAFPTTSCCARPSRGA